MPKSNKDKTYQDLTNTLKIDCDKCSGLCCVALYCMKTDGFPADKEAEIPCKNLMLDSRCSIHSNLVVKNMKGCLAYDCFGAGQKVTQVCYPDSDWRTVPQQSSEMFHVFLIVFQLHQMLWYLIEAFSLVSEEHLKADIHVLIHKNEQMTGQGPTDILNIDIENYRTKVNNILKKVSETIACGRDDCNQAKDFFGHNFKKSNLDGRDFSMALMIAANLDSCSLLRTNFLGADMRDANIKNTDLSESQFLTQMQINSAKGNKYTKLPMILTKPASW